MKRLSLCSSASSIAPGLFHPGNAHGLFASRALLRPKSGDVSPRRPPPMPLGRAETQPRLRRLDLSGQAVQPDRSRATRSALLAFFPSEALPLAAGRTVTRPLLSRACLPGPPRQQADATDAVGAPQSLTSRRAGFTIDAASDISRYRPLWGLPPLRTLRASPKTPKGSLGRSLAARSRRLWAAAINPQVSQP